MPAIVLLRNEIKELKERIQHERDEREIIHLENMLRASENLLFTIIEERRKKKNNNSDEQWGRCFWCNTISHDAMIEYDDNGEQVCPECKRAGAMLKV